MRTARSDERPLTLRYIVALSVIAVLSIAAHAVLQNALTAQAGHAAEINISGRQRMLSQRIAQQVSLLASGGEAPYARVNTLTANLVDQLDASHTALVSGDDTLGLPGDPSPQLRQIYFGRADLDAKVQGYVATARRVLSLPRAAVTPDAPVVRAVERIAQGTAERDLLPLLDAAVTAYELEARRAGDRVGNISWGMLLVTLVVLALEGRYVFLPTVRRVTERSRSLDATQRRLRAILDNALVAVITAQPDGHIVDANRRANELFGTDPALVGRRIGALAPSSDAREALTRLVAAAADGDQTTTEVQMRGRRRFTARLSASATRGLSDPLVSVVVADVTEQRDAERRLRHLALHDPLTGLANRTLFADRVEHTLAGMTRADEVVCVLFIDLDDFKSVNDSLGHQAGDQLLTTIGERIAACVRPSDTAARLGGDEFAVVVDDLPTLETVRTIAERIRQMLALPIDIDGQDVVVGASIGVATGTPSSTAEDLLRDADTAMYDAKRSGKNTTRFFTTSMHDTAVHRLGIRSDLARAIEHDALDLHYQPIVDLVGHRLVGVEALARWTDPVRGVVSPAEFIPVAEEGGLIVDLGRWVLRRAIHDAAGWLDEYGDDAPGYLSVNVSVLQLSPQFVSDVREALAGTISPSSLVLEITESALMRDRSDAARVLATLRQIGVRVAIDDFGTGYSSLAYLQQLPVDILKIDRGFVARMHASEAGMALVRSMLDVSRSLGLHTIAEGVETLAQADVLAGLHCELAQGYHFAEPLDAGRLRDYLARHSADARISDADPYAGSRTCQRTSAAPAPAPTAPNTNGIANP